MILGIKGVRGIEQSVSV